jgi:O-antigen ligase
MNTTAFVGACILALGAPFELTTPIVRLPWQSVSNLELLLAGVCGAWFLSIVVARREPAWQTPLTGPWVALIAAMFVAAATAPADRVNALHMSARLTAGAVVFLMTVDGIRTPERLRRAMLAAVVSGGIVAILAVLEYFRTPLVLQALRAFRPGLALVGAQVRAGGSLAYPTIASMYLEIVFALGLGVLLTALDSDSRAYARVTFAALVVIAYAVTLTFTRAGLATIAVSLTIVGVARYLRRGADRGARAVAWLALVVVVMVASSRSTQAMWLRLTSEGQGTWYRASVQAPAALSLTAGGSTTVPVRVTNVGRLTWDSTGDSPFFLAYHWLKADGTRVVSFEGARTPFPEPVPAGASVAIDAVVWAPQQSGQFRLQWDLVQEHRLWFNTEPDAPAPTVSAATVTGDAAVASGPTLPLPKHTVRPGRLALWRIAARMFAAHPVLGVGPDNFRLEYGSVAGLPDADPRTHTNSMYIEMFVGGGIVGGLAFLWLMWSAARLSAGAVRRYADARLMPALGVAAAIAAVLVHGVVDSFFSFTPAYVVIAFTLGLAVASTYGAAAGSNADCV